jgi:hypothetical protein
MEKEPQQIQLNLDPNAYAITNVNMASDEELFHFMLISGNQGRQFTATPKHGKRIYLLLKQNIEAYEKKFGEIKTQLPQKPGNTKEDKVGF